MRRSKRKVEGMVKDDGYSVLRHGLSKVVREEGRQEGVGKRGKERNGRRKWKEKEELNQWVFGCLMIVTGALSKGGKGGGRGRRMEGGVAKGR